jgi:hypothetical protein
MPAPQIGRAAASRSLQRDVIAAAWKLPADVIALLLPHGLQPATLPDQGDSRSGLVVLWSSLRSAARWAPLPESWGETYRHAELRIPVFWNETLAHVVVRSYISHAGLAQALFPLSATTVEGRFDIVVDGNPVSGTIDSATLAVSTETPRIRIRVERETDREQMAPRPEALALVDNPDTHVHFPRIGRKNAIVHRVAFETPQWQSLTIGDAFLADIPSPWDHPDSPVFARYAPSIETRTWPERGTVPPASTHPRDEQPQSASPTES